MFDLPHTPDDGPPVPGIGSASFTSCDLPPEFRRARAARGMQSFHAGIAAEEITARHYCQRGCAVLARRWRCKEGEIDLIIRDENTIVFVEVKARCRPIHDDPVSQKQWQRLEAAALRYMVIAETGTAPLRFDLALVGRDGCVEVTKNARL
ncbi:MAG: YraN family protein [Pseudomonadota bacterium]